MEVLFQGFRSGLPIGWYVLLFMGSIALSWWSYRNIQGIGSRFRYALITLRSLVFLILFALLLNPFFQTQTLSFIKPTVQVFLDNSESVTVEKGRYNGISTYKEVIEQLDFADSSEVKFEIYAISDSIYRASPGTLSFKASHTNLYEAVEKMNSPTQSPQAALLISDGIYTTGRDPSYLSSQVSIPVYSVGLGDTVEVNDLIVRDVVTNNVGYTNTEHPIEVTVLNNGFAKRTFTVQLKSNNEVVASRSVTPSTKESSHQVNFAIPLETEGLKQYTVHIPGFETEWNKANNNKHISIDVQSNKQRILHIAFEIYPDVKTLRSVLASDKNTQLTSKTWTGENNFIEGPLPTVTDTFDLLALHGYPHPNIPNAVREQVNAIIDKLPVAYFATPMTELSVGSSSVFPVNTSGSPKAMKANFYPVDQQREHAIMKLPEINYEDIPYLFAPIRNIKLNTGSSPLLNVSYRGTQTDIPLLAVQEMGNLRRTIFNAYGYYRYHLSYNKSLRRYIDKLLYNIISWTSTRPGDKLLRVKPAQKAFDSSDPVKLNAFLKDESGQPESNGNVEIQISSQKLESRTYTMRNQGNGRYSVDLGTMPEGIYKFEARAEKGDQTVGRHEGEFSVTSTNIEYVNTTRNENFLKQIASSTGGQYFDFSQAGQLRDAIQADGILKKKKTIDTDILYPYQHAFWFIIVVILLGIEWFIRKYLALP